MLRSIVAFVILGSSALAFADPKGAAVPKLTVKETIEINAKPEAVWAVVKDFDALASWHPAFSKSELIRGTNNKPGAVRAVTVKDGPTFNEQLLNYNEHLWSMGYRMGKTELPLSDYYAQFHLNAAGGKTLVTWIGHFNRKDPANPNPPAGEDDKAATDLVKGVYQSGLSALKKKAEGG